MSLEAKTKHAREFKEAWYSIDNNTINRHIDIPPAFLQLKHSSDKHKYFRQPRAINESAPVIQDCPTMTTHPTTTNQTLQPTKEPIRRSRRIQQQKQKREDLKFPGNRLF